MIRIAEIFHSVQGEGKLTGVESVFIRTSGCNLRCWYCDTPYASWQPEGDAQSLDTILKIVNRYDCRHTVITGGEPMIQAELPTLVSRLQADGQHVTIETAGTILPADPISCDLISISPKLSNSTPDRQIAGAWTERHEKIRHQPEIVRYLMKSNLDYQLKFVVGSILDAEEVLEYVEWLGDYDRGAVMMMPRATTNQELDWQAEWLIPWCHKHQFTFCDRAHIRWFGNRRGT